MSLRWRLFATYFLLLTVTLAVIIGSLLVFFSARPEPPLQTYRELASVSQAMIDELLPTTTGRLARARLSELSTEYDVRILLMNGANQTVEFDSAQLIAEGTAVELNRDRNYDVLGRTLQLSGPYVGGFNDPATGQPWLFLGLQTRFQNITAVLGKVQSTRTLNDALAEFGSSIAAPLIQSGIVGLVFAFILAAFISRQIAKPLGAVADAAGAVARGDYEVSLPETGASEVRAVAQAFNTMTREVRSTQQSQRDFLENVSHDLKTPLTSIQGYSQAIIDGAVREPAAAAEVIYSEADRLSRMVTDLTDLARLQSGRVSLHLDRVDIAALTEALAQRIEVVAKKKNVALRVNSPGSIVVAADGDRMAQVITNLLSNAVKFTPENGHVNVSLRGLDNGVEVAVHDSGIGIPQNELTRVFERFYQVDKARGPKRGTGLGLAIAKEIVTAHGGRIRAESVGEGHGSTFVVWLPATPPVTAVVSRA